MRVPDQVTAPTGRLEHASLLYRTAGEFLTGTADFVRRGLTAGEPVLVAVPAANAELLRTALAGAAGVRLVDMTEAGRNPARIIPLLRRFTDSHADRAGRFVGEPVWVGQSPAEVEECTRHEALLNEAFARTPVSILCPYDAAHLDPATLADASRTHPVIVEGGRRRTNPGYAQPALIYARPDPPLAGPPAGTPVVSFARDDLTRLRRSVHRAARAAGLPFDRADDLVLAVNEVATNSITHAGSGGTLRTWLNADELICEVRDGGRIVDPLVGRRAPSRRAEDGRGLWMVNQLCDLVEIRSDERGTTVRLHARRIGQQPGG